VPPDKKSRFKQACTTHGTNMSNVLNDLIDEWLDEHSVDDVPVQESLPLTNLRKAS
jgi:hypothetical protein